MKDTLDKVIDAFDDTVAEFTHRPAVDIPDEEVDLQYVAGLIQDPLVEIPVTRAVFRSRIRC